MEKKLALPELSYENYRNEKMTLHLFLQIMGKIRLKLSPRKNHWWFVTLYVDTKGLTTGPIPINKGLDSFSITLNVHQDQLEILTSNNDMRKIELRTGLTVADFYNELKSILQELGIYVNIKDRPFDLAIDQPFAELKSYYHYDQKFMKTLWQILIWVENVFKEFSGRFFGKTSPVHLYWHSMDLAVTRFSGRKAPAMPVSARISDKDAYSHECISFGFWAGDENLPEPAFYSYTYPAPEGIESKQLQPAKAVWIQSNGSPMAILRYKDLINGIDPRTELLAFMETAYQAGASSAGWDIEKFRVPALNEL